MTGPAEGVELLLVEDNVADVRLMREALRDAARTSNLHVAGDGEEALAYLRGEGAFADRVASDIVILDLNLPRKHGLDVLAEIRSDPALKLVPVIVLSTSTSPVDVTEAYGRGANCYIVKPVDFDHFRQVVAAIDVFWLGVVQLASGPIRPETSVSATRAGADGTRGTLPGRRGPSSRPDGRP